MGHNLCNAVELLGQGMLGIFVVLVVIAGMVQLLKTWDSKKGSK